MSRRKVFHSSPTRDGWKVTQGGQTVTNHRTQRASEDKAVSLGRAEERKGGLGQAVFHRADGVVKSERTYGQDPPEKKG